MTKSLQSLMPYNPVTIAKLRGLKSIIRVETPRTRRWYLVTPAVGDGDAKCTLIRDERRKESRRHDANERNWVEISDYSVKSDYADRIIPTNPAPLVFPTAKPGDSAFSGFTKSELEKMEEERISAVKHWEIK